MALVSLMASVADHLLRTEAPMDGVDVSASLSLAGSRSSTR
jgi:hypothetical protein